MVVVVIETTPGLSNEELTRAAELGPAEVRASAALCSMVRSVGFDVVREEDLTEEFERAVADLLGGLRSEETELRRAEGDEEYQYELDRRTSMLAGIRAGLIRRTFLAAIRP